MSGQVLENSLMNMKLFSTPNVLCYILQKDGLHPHVRGSCDVPKCNVNDVCTWKIGIVKETKLRNNWHSNRQRQWFMGIGETCLVLLGISHPSHLVSNKTIIVNQNKKSKDDASFK